MTDYHHIYANHADEYDAMVRAEDCDGNLSAAIAAWVSPGSRVLEVGVGTGRITEMLCARGATVVGCEPAPAMLSVARRRLAAWMPSHVELHATDCAGLPSLPANFDVAIAGWVFGHVRSWRAADWRDVIANNLERMQAALEPGGTIVVIETLGTGDAEPRPPRPELAEYYAWLENELGFDSRSLRTDYLFASPDEAARATEFFFGADFAERVRSAGRTRIPECTGLWWKRVTSRRSGSSRR